MSHYTSDDDKSFANRLTFDFVAQLEERLATTQMSQADLAKKLKVGESTVSQVLNLYRTNFSLETFVKYARAVGMKVALVAYDDGDPTNQNGPVGPEIFTLSWEKFGRPRDVWSVNETNIYATKQYSYAVPWTYGWTNSTLDDVSGTTGELLHMSQMHHLLEKATSSHAGNEELHI